MKAKKETFISVRMTENDKKEIQRKADADGRSLSNYVQNKLKNE